MAETNQFIYRIKPTRLEMLTTGPTPSEQQIVSDHFDYLKDLCSKGVVVLAGRTLTPDEQAFGIAILHGCTEEQASNIMLNDPAVKLGVMRAEIFPFRIAMLWDEKLQ